MLTMLILVCLILFGAILFCSQVFGLTQAKRNVAPAFWFDDSKEDDVAQVLQARHVVPKFFNEGNVRCAFFESVKTSVSRYQNATNGSDDDSEQSD